MTDPKSVNPVEANPLTSPIRERDPSIEIKRLRRELDRLHQENCDLLLTLRITTEHGDLIEGQLQETNRRLHHEVLQRQQAEAKLHILLNQLTQHNTDLQTMLEIVRHHGDVVDGQWSARMDEANQLLIDLLQYNADLQVTLDILRSHGDVSQEQWVHQVTQTHNLIYQDALTQVANRRRFDDYLEQQWQQMAREQQALTLIMCDIDFFKDYNDSLGHTQGDECLKQVAHLLQSVLKRPDDLVARYGGEEFALVLPHTNEEGARHIATQILETLHCAQIPHPRSAVAPYITVSLGIASTRPQPGSGNQRLFLLDQADQYLYRAKRQGRNCWIDSGCLDESPITVHE